MTEQEKMLAGKIYDPSDGGAAGLGAGSVVTRDIPAGSLAAGVPCRVIREITEADALEHHQELF